MQRSSAGRIRAGDLRTLDELAQVASSCELCRLCHDRTQVVTGAGPAGAEVLVVAEAPGYHEDREGHHLAGRTGRLFDETLQLAGLSRDRIYLTSVVKCRPPLGRAPFPDEVEACESWLFREIALVEPRVIVTLGALALRLVTGRHERLADVHGGIIHAHLQGRDMVVWPLFHPAAAVHVPGLVRRLHDDARALGSLLRGARAEARDVVNAHAAELPTSETPSAPVIADHAPAALPPDDDEPQLAFDVG